VTEPETARDRPRAVVEVLAVAAGVVAFVGLVWAVRGELGMTWDEPYFFERQHDVGAWLGRLAGTSAERSEALGRAGMERAWRFCREVPDQHPPVPELLSLATGTAFGRLVGPLRADRLSTVLVFAVAAGVMSRFVRARWGPWASAAALGALLFDPRPFAHAQQITADSDTGAFWFLAAVAFLRSCETGRRAWLFGVLAGLAVMCKATGVLVLPAMLLWALIHRPPGWWKPPAWALATIPLTMIALMPPWWASPILGPIRWARAFLAYPQKVPVCYLGTVYDSVRTFLPWHNTIVLTATMVPPGLLLLAVLGLARAAFARRAPADATPPGRLPDRVVGSWAAINFLTWMVLRAFPILPAHDGLRQLVPAFYFLPVLAGSGAARLAGSWPGWKARAGRFAVAACLASAAWETLHIHPFELSYYNILIGGPRGAKAAGMESTYFWDSATSEVLGWMNANLPPNSTVLIFPPPNVLTFGWEQRRGRLRRDLRILNLDPPEFAARLARMSGPDPCYLIFQIRQGLYLPRRPGDPTFFARLAESPALYSLAPPRVSGVRLLAIFDQADFRRALEAQAR
jgi:hypothetical protein